MGLLARSSPFQGEGPGSIPGSATHRGQRTVHAVIRGFESRRERFDQHTGCEGHWRPHLIWDQESPRSTRGHPTTAHPEWLVPLDVGRMARWSRWHGSPVLTRETRVRVPYALREESRGWPPLGGRELRLRAWCSGSDDTFRAALQRRAHRLAALAQPAEAPGREPAQSGFDSPEPHVLHHASSAQQDEHPSRKREDRVRVPEEARRRGRHNDRRGNAPVAQRQRQRAQIASSPGSNPGRGTIPGWCSWQHAGLWIREPRFDPWTGSSQETRSDARWSSWQDAALWSRRAEVRILDGQQRPGGGTGRRTRLKPACPPRWACRFDSCRGHISEGWPSQARHRVATPWSGAEVPARVRIARPPRTRTRWSMAVCAAL
jgi:hypothetical protein